MYFNNTEVDTQPSIEKFVPKPTWGETVEASFKNFTSVNLSTSEMNYYHDELKLNIKEWKKKAPENEEVFKRLMIMSPEALDNYENLFEKGKIDLIADDKSEIFGMTGGEAFLRYKEIQKKHGFTNLNKIKESADDKARTDFLTSAKILKDSDYTSAKLIGTAGGVMTDPITQATFPLGSFVTGGSVMVNALRAFGQEALIETAAQAVIAPKVYAYKNELGLKTSIMEEATQAVMSVATAGTFRAVGSATYDLTAKGIAQLKAKDPELAKDYENLMSGKVTDNLNEHIDNMHKVEFGSGVDEIKNPNAKGKALAEEQPHTEFEEIKAKEYEAPEDIKLTIGKDEQGMPMERSYKELTDEIDIEDKQMTDLFNCLRGA